MLKKIKECRICGNNELIPILNLGDQYLTSIFPDKDELLSIKKYPLNLVKCHGKENCCNLVQLEHSVDKKQMYCDNYGYRSGLNNSMAIHLQKRIKKISSYVNLKRNDVVVDIGSNDGTTLSFYPEEIRRIGIDPTAKKFKKFYKKNITLIDDFFSANAIKKEIGKNKVKVITSFAMFYDLDEPLKFAKEVADILDPKEGIWVLEQSYLPKMMEMISFDTICHEHLEYYSLIQIQWIMEKVGLKITNVEFNNVNGGSFTVTACMLSNTNLKQSYNVNKIINNEKNMDLRKLQIFEKFSSNVIKFKKDLYDFLEKLIKKNKRIYGLGASTKGNVILQYCKIDKNMINAIGEINSEKFGKFTPGSCIPIKNEREILEKEHDFLFILPWHFKDFFISNVKYKNSNLLFPLPKIQQIIRRK